MAAMQTMTMITPSARWPSICDGFKLNGQAISNNPAMIRYSQDIIQKIGLNHATAFPVPPTALVTQRQVPNLTEPVLCDSG